MQKLTATLALAAVLCTGTAFAAETNTPDSQERPVMAEPGKHPGKPGPGKRDKKPPRFEDCDKNSDGALSLEEFQACHPRKSQERFDAIDTNKDGKITREEMRAFHEKRRQERLSERFRACDTNADGVLSFDEFEQCAPKPGDKKGKHDKRPPRDGKR